MLARLRTALAIAGLAIATQTAAQIVFYEREGFQGRSFTTEGALGNLGGRFGDRASSVIVLRGRWEVCDDAGFRGRCAVLRPGRYPSLADTGLNNRISSVRDVPSARRVRDEQYAPPPPMPVYDSRRRGGERLYQARITAVRAVVATPERRCWVEREQVPAERGSANVPGAIAGAVIGGILGHQIGGGTGRDIATAGGAVAGAAVGANIGRDDTPAYTRDVQRCASAPAAARPDYWDVSYEFRGVEHHMQTVEAPGATVTVNRRGEPRS